MGRGYGSVWVWAWVWILWPTPNPWPTAVGMGKMWSMWPCVTMWVAIEPQCFQGFYPSSSSLSSMTMATSESSQLHKPLLTTKCKQFDPQLTCCYEKTTCNLNSTTPLPMIHAHVFWGPVTCGSKSGALFGTLFGTLWLGNSALFQMPHQ